MKIIIQSFGDIITNSSTETFCISNGSTSDLQLLIDTTFAMYSKNDNPTWEYQEKFERLGKRYHLS